MNNDGTPLKSQFDPKTYGYSKNHPCYHDEPSRPGYFEYDGHLARRLGGGQLTQRWNQDSNKWEWVPDEAYFRYEARGITHEEAEGLARKYGVTEPLTAL